MDQAIELADLIQRLRHELSTAMRAGEGTDLRFEPGPVELELTVAIEKSSDPGVKVRFWVLELGASSRRMAGVTQRIKLTLDPRRGDDPERRPFISGQELPGER
jgi:hypothetical protein